MKRIMKKTNSYSKYVSDEEFEKQFEEATKRGEETMRTQPHAVAVRYDKKQKRVVIELSNDCVFIFPPGLVEGLTGRTEQELSDVKILGAGFTLEWSKLDHHYSVAGLMQGMFGSKAWMAELGRKGGSVTSERKAEASRRNGQLGGVKGGRPQVNDNTDARKKYLREKKRESRERQKQSA